MVDHFLDFFFFFGFFIAYYFWVVDFSGRMNAPIKPTAKNRMTIRRPIFFRLVFSYVGCLISSVVAGYTGAICSFSADNDSPLTSLPAIKEFVISSMLSYLFFSELCELFFSLLYLDSLSAFDPEAFFCYQLFIDFCDETFYSGAYLGTGLGLLAIFISFCYGWTYCADSCTGCYSYGLDQTTSSGVCSGFAFSYWPQALDGGLVSAAGSTSGRIADVNFIIVSAVFYMSILQEIQIPYFSILVVKSKLLFQACSRNFPKLFSIEKVTSSTLSSQSSESTLQRLQVYCIFFSLVI